MNQAIKVAIVIAVIMGMMLVAQQVFPKPDKGSYCWATGGTVLSQQCCSSTEDFPNNCVIGACGCAPEYSHPVRTCQCPEGHCFNGEKCV